MYSISSGARRKLIGTATAPSRWHASSASTNSMPVVQKQRDAIAGLHAVAGEDRGEARGAIVKLGVRSGVVAEHDREMVRTRSARPARELGQRQPA